MVFFMVFLFSGILSLVRIIPYRMGLVSLLVIPLFFLYKIKVDRVLLAFTALAGIVLISAYLNDSNLREIVLFGRTLIFSYLIYFLASRYLTEKTIIPVIRFCAFIAVLQLPVVFIQKQIYYRLPVDWTAGIGYHDFGFGTFNIKGDASMTFFLILLTIFILFNEKRNYVIPYKWFVAVWLTITVLYTNSEVSKLTILGVWAVFLVYRLNIRRLLIAGFSLILVVIFTWSTGILKPAMDNLYAGIMRNMTASSSTEERFLSGNYGRGAALLYYLNQDIKWFGDGPLKYYDPLNRAFTLGNTGHAFTYYAEIGIIGLTTSILVLYLMGHAGRPLYTISMADVLNLLAILALSFVIFVMNDISVILAYCIFSKAYLIPPKQKKHSTISENSLAVQPAIAG